MRNLTGKVAIVTGASRGIGRGIAERLAQDGATVVVNYSGSEEEAKQVVGQVTSQGGKAIALQANFSLIDDIRRLFQEVSDLYGQIDILFNNAGTGIVATIADVTEADYNKVFDLNVRGVLFAMQEAARRMNDGGRIINISPLQQFIPNLEWQFMPPVKQQLNYSQQ